MLVSCREGGSVPRTFGAPPLLPCPATRSCRARYLLAWRSGLRCHARPASPLYPTRHFVVSVSGHGGVPPWPSPTRLSRSVVLHRGHASRSAPTFGPSALRAPCYGADRLASPLYPSRCVVAQSAATAGYGPCQVLGVFRFAPPVGAESCWRSPAAGTRFAALRVYILCCFAKCAPVAPLKLRLVPPTAARPCGFTKPTICKVPCAGVGRLSRRRSPVASAPYAPPSGRPCSLSCLPGFNQALRAHHVLLARGRSSRVVPPLPTPLRPRCCTASARRAVSRTPTKHPKTSLPLSCPLTGEFFR